MSRVDSLGIVLQAHSDGASDVVNLKISKLGGLTRTRQARDLCVANGIAMTIEDSWGGDITTAAIAHLAHSTPPELLFTSTDFNSYVSVNAEGRAPGAARADERASAAPGLGISPGWTCSASRAWMFTESEPRPAPARPGAGRPVRGCGSRSRAWGWASR
ncbi:MAG: enolase C-terminal domain-like protein [Isosphaeraceae bacterium]